MANLAQQLRKWGLRLWGWQAVLWRAVLGLGVGWVLLFSDFDGGHDLRLRLRPPQSSSSQLVLLNVSRGDLTRFQHPDHSERLEAEDFEGLWAGFFEDQVAKESALRQLAQAGARAVVIAGVVPSSLSEVFLDEPRIHWFVPSPPAKVRAKPRPLLANQEHWTFGSDPDGVVRRLRWLDYKGRGWLGQVFSGHLQDSGAEWINFRGPAGTFKSLSWTDWARGRISPSSLKGKIVVIGTSEFAEHKMVTPVGWMPSHEFFANVVDNALEGRWPRKASKSNYLFYISFVFGVLVWILLKYSQSVVLVSAFLIIVFTGGLSAWLFDRHYFWLPTLSVWVSVASGVFLFLSYQLDRNQKRAWKLEQDRQNLIELEKLKDNFLSLFSHDLKTPISRIQAICDRWISSGSLPEAQPDFRSLRASSQELNRYIQSILQLSRIEAQNLKMNRQPGDLNDLVNRVCERLSAAAKEKQITIERDLEPLFAIEIDIILIGEVLLNLIENAIQYSRPGGRIRVETREIGEMAQVCVCDEGVGISEPDLPRIWDKFYRTSQGRASGGTGLGLYLVKYFVGLHQGEVFVSSRLNGGTQIGFRVPLVASQAREAVDVGT